MKILLCGATGSIAKSFYNLDLDHELVGISYHTNIEFAHEIISKYNLKFFYSELDKKSTCESIDDLIDKSNPDIVINAVTGLAGLEYTIKIINHKKTLCLANKESLVIAGHFIKQLLRQNDVILIPIDSEHTSLKEIVNKYNKNIKKLYITCSGGRYYKLAKHEWKNITYEQAIKHPNWTMGSKISIDSATLLNKCFEIVEAYYLFDTKHIEALYHPQSIIHSLVEFDDHSVFANMSYPDMKLSIKLAIDNFDKSSLKNAIKPLDFTNLTLNLEKINIDEWKPIKWAYEIINDHNHCLGTIINFANERAIELFKTKKITFDKFYEVIQTYINKYASYKVENIDDIFKLLAKMKNELIA